MERVETRIISLSANRSELSIATEVIADKANALLDSTELSGWIVREIRQISLTSVFRPEHHMYQVSALLLVSAALH